MCPDTTKRAAQGAIAGVLGTLVLQGVVLAMQHCCSQAETPEAEDPASFMLWQAEKHLPQKTWLKIPAAAETAAGIGLSLGYGATFGAMYGALRGEKGCTVVDGVVLSAAVWAVGYMGWLPAAKLTPPVWRQTPMQMVGPLIEHLAYGVVTVAAYDILSKRW